MPITARSAIWTASEMYLELNLSDEAGELAERALARFDELGMTYEAAKAVTNLALATSRQRDVRRARQLFDRARQLFGRERNQVWLGLLDFYEALVLYRAGAARPRSNAVPEARWRVSPAPRYRPGPPFAISCWRAWSCRPATCRPSERACHAAFERTRGGGDTESDVSGALGARPGSRSARRSPAPRMKRSRRRIAASNTCAATCRATDLKVAFLEDKQAVYESLVSIGLALEPTRGQLEAAFGYIEKAKSRSLADLIAFRAGSLAPRVAGKATEAVHRLRQELNWHYRQSELEEIRREKRSARRHGRVATADSRARETAEPIARRAPPDGRGVLRAPERRSRSAWRRFARASRRTRSSSSTTRPGGRPMSVCSDAISSTSCPWGPSRTCGASCGCCNSSSRSSVSDRTMSAHSPSSCRRRPRRTFASFMRRSSRRSAIGCRRHTWSWCRTTSCTSCRFTRCSTASAF